MQSGAWLVCEQVHELLRPTAGPAPDQRSTMETLPPRAVGQTSSSIDVQ